MSEFIIYASLVASILSLGYCLYIYRMRRKYTKENDKASITGQRKRLENQIYSLNEILLGDPERLFDNTKLLLQFPDKDLSINSVIPNHSFYKDLGIDLGNVKVKDKTVFCLMPFHKSFDKTYLTIKDACQSNGYECYRSDTPYNPGKLLNQIVQLILDSQLIVAVLDGKNPNVFYEIGLAHIIGKTVILIANMSNVKDIPFDLRSDRLLLYSNPKDLKNKLSNILGTIHYV